MIIDTHCHLDDSRFENDLGEVIDRAKSKGILGILIPGADPDSLRRAREISHEFPEVYYAAGVHPYDIHKYDEKTLLEYLEDPRCIAVGECGLDYYRLPEEEQEAKENVAMQKRIFAAQIELAKRVKKPLVVHIRDASGDAMELLLEYGAKEVGGVLHCYNADERLLKLADSGFYYGIGGVLTFKNAKKLPRVLPKIPKDRIVVETDAPYLAPHPFRGKRNEPGYTVHIVEKIADTLSMSYDEVAALTTQNAKRLFKEFSTLEDGILI